MTRKLAGIAKGFRQTSLKRVCASATYPIVRGGIMFSGCSSVCACVAGRTHYPTGLPSTSSLLYCVCVTLLDDRHMQTDTQTDTLIAILRCLSGDGIISELSRHVVCCVRRMPLLRHGRRMRLSRQRFSLSLVRWFYFWPFRCQVTTLGKFFLHTRASVKQYKVVPVKRR